MNQGTRDCRPLLFAPTELMKKMIRPLPEPHRIDQLGGSFIAFPRRDALQEQWKSNVLPDVHRREKIKELKDEAYLAAPELG